MQDRTLTHRTIQNTAIIRGLTSAVEMNLSRIRMALINPNKGETLLQETLADLMQDIRILESAIVEQEQ